MSRAARFYTSPIKTMMPQGPPGGAKMEAKIDPRASPERLSEIWLQGRPWAPPGASDELFLVPGALPRAIWSAPGAHFWPTWGLGLQELIFDPPEALQGSFLTYFSKVSWVQF